jgi:pyridoxine/pyridoxamine 5'-phosphate oxidase
MEADHEYFARRAREERTGAEAAGSSEARAAHLELAERYDDLARAIEAHRLDPKLFA